jgi:ubiquinol-cytochrome c reductase iron-sulfur subunit
VFRKQPVFLRNLTRRKSEADAVSASTLRDPQTLEQRTKEGHKNWLITMGCLHPPGLRAAGRRRRRGEGRVRRLLLPLPRFGLRYRGAHPQRPGTEESRSASYEFTSDTVVKIG